ALMQLLVLDPPLVQELGTLWILDADDVQTSWARLAVSHSGHVSVRTGQILLDIEIRDAQRWTQREVAEYLDIVASALEGRRLGQESLGRKQGERGESGNRSHPGDRE
ncbi:MAG: hypothetical protein O7E50_01285, partial [Gemmatimonadetes bacterium]|nr:hypothetical protein [Gemmatimonadota bacterium]